MATNQQFITRALAKIGISGEIDGDVLNQSFIELQDFMCEIEANGMDVDYDFNSAITGENGVDKKFFSAITAILANRLSETFDIVAGINIERQANTGAQTLAKLTTQTPEWRQPNRMPIGSGNNKNGYEWRRFYSDIRNTDVSSTS